MDPGLLTETEPLSGRILKGRFPFQGGVLRGSEEARDFQSGIPNRSSQATKPAERSGRRGDSGAKAEDVVPVFARRAHAVDRGMEGHHGLGHGFSGVIEVEAAMEDAGLGHQVG